MDRSYKIIDLNRDTIMSILFEFFSAVSALKLYAKSYEIEITVKAR
jgi:hypothetical protein